MYLNQFFFVCCLSPFTPTGLSGTLRSAFLIFFPLRVRRGSGVLSPATNVHPLYLNQLLQNKTINKKALPEQISFIYFFHFFTYSTYHF
jgi:hypothetical protein